MKIGYNKRVYGIGNTCLGCSKCALADNTCLGNKGYCFLSLNEIFVYDNYSQLFEL